MFCHIRELQGRRHAGPTLAVAIRGDTNGDGEITRADEYGEELYGVTVVFNSDDDNGNEVADWEETDVEGEDDLTELHLTAGSCSHGDWPSWSLSWDRAAPLVVWWQSDKYCDDCLPGTEEEPIYNLSEYPDALYPLSVLPRSVWLEATDNVGDDYDITFTVHAGGSEKRLFAASGPSDSDKVRVQVSGCRWRGLGKRWFTRAIKYATDDNITRVSAVIDNCEQEPLCPEACYNPKGLGLSAVFVAVVRRIEYEEEDEPDELLWSNFGYTRRKLGGNVIEHGIYAETVYESYTLGSADIVRDWYLSPYDPDDLPEPSGGAFHKYSVMVSQIDHKWYYRVDNSHFYACTKQWASGGFYGTEAHWATELLNIEDRMVGTAGDPCRFSDCAYNEDWGPDLDSIAESDIKYKPETPGENDWGYRWIDGKTFEVWDKHPETTCD